MASLHCPVSPSPSNGRPLPAASAMLQVLVRHLDPWPPSTLYCAPPPLYSLRERVFCHLRSVSTQAGPSPELLRKTLMVFTPLSNPEHLKLYFLFYLSSFYSLAFSFSFLSAHYFSFYVFPAHLVPSPSISPFPPVLCVSFPNSHDPFLPHLPLYSLLFPSSFPLLLFTLPPFRLPSLPSHPLHILLFAFPLPNRLSSYNLSENPQACHDEIRGYFLACLNF